MKKWTYFGDMHLEDGGFYWKHDREDDDFVSIVEVLCDGDMGGADNVFNITVGSLYLDADNATLKAAYDCCGQNMEDQSIATKVHCLKAYLGFDIDESHWIRIGKVDPLTGDATCEEIDIFQINGRSKIKNYVERNFLFE